jgi:hypothetical protein
VWAVAVADGLLIKSPDLINGMSPAIRKMGWNYFVMYISIPR